MLNQDSPLAALLEAPLRPGRVTWIGVRPARRVAMIALPEVWLDPADGLAGDHYPGSGHPGRGPRTRQVTLIDVAALAAIAGYLGLAALEPARLRRNIVVAGINLHALKGARFRLGAAVLEATGQCHPCSRMEEEFGPGGYQAVRGHGGITARVAGRGLVQLGDPVARIGDCAADAAAEPPLRS